MLIQIKYHLQSLRNTFTQANISSLIQIFMIKKSLPTLYLLFNY